VPNVDQDQLLRVARVRRHDGAVGEQELPRAWNPNECVTPGHVREVAPYGRLVDEAIRTGRVRGVSARTACCSRQVLLVALSRKFLQYSPVAAKQNQRRRWSKFLRPSARHRNEGVAENGAFNVRLQ
jgi:hypothetical protein